MEEVINFVLAYWYFILAGIILVVIFILLATWSNTKKEKNVDVDKKQTNQQKMKVEEKQEQSTIKNTDEVSYLVGYDHKDKLWIVRKSDAKRASKRFTTKKEAVDYAKQLSDKNNSQLIVNKKYDE